MCGILAILWINKNKNKYIYTEANAGYTSLIKRGPDMGRQYENEAGLFFFRRLAINDLSDSAMQPFIKNGVVVMCNGEIYNSDKLKKKYNINTFSKSDCECLLELYLKLGFEKMIKELDGIFAVVISDTSTRRVYLATDRIGVRPLFYGTGNYSKADDAYADYIVIGSTAESLSEFNLISGINHFKPGILSISTDREAASSGGDLGDLFNKVISYDLTTFKPQTFINSYTPNNTPPKDPERSEVTLDYRAARSSDGDRPPLSPPSEAVKQATRVPGGPILGPKEEAAPRSPTAPLPEGGRWLKRSLPEAETEGGGPPVTTSGFIEKRINKLLLKAVRKQIISDRPIECMLSGGLDSSLICSILCKILGPKNVRTYSIGMNGSTDLRYAKFLAENLGTIHTEVYFTPEDGLSAIPFVIKDLETYDITTIRASVGMWLLSKYISENTKDRVIFSGEGADELFCGYLYFHYAPSDKSLEEESYRLVENLYKYDVLRADRSVSSHGIELRVPFLDNKLVDFCLSIPGSYKKPINGIEKYILRKSFDLPSFAGDCGYLPSEILWRRKEGYSDGVSSLEKSWFEYIKEHVENIISDSEFTPFSTIFPSKESYYYKKVYDTYFPNYKQNLEYWMPKWVECNGDPSGRKVEVFSKNIVIT